MSTKKQGRGSVALHDQYLDVVDFITQHPDEVISAYDYLDWPNRDTNIDWNAESRVASAHRVQDRLDQLAVAATVPARPRVATETRTALWLPVLAEAGAYYRTGNGKSGTYVLDTAARWVTRQRSHGRKAELLGNRWEHTPNARVRDAIGPFSFPPKGDDVAGGQAVEQSTPVNGVRLDHVDPTPEELTAAAQAASTPEPAPEPAVSYVIEGADPQVGGRIVVRTTAADGHSWLLIAEVTAFVPVSS